ncbi:MAG: lysine--tRNA ligase, partial [Candidatus Methylomirabilales bacterium]
MGGPIGRPVIPADHEQARAEKLHGLRARGEEPYPARFERTHSVGDLLETYSHLPPASETGQSVRVAGRVMTLRRHGGLAFADLRDWTGKVQLFAQADRLGARFEDLLEIDLGDFLGLWGEVVTTRKGELSVRVEGFRLLSKSLRPWPEKWHGLKDIEARYRQRYLDLATNPAFRRILLDRSKAVAETRSFFDERGFVEVETPMLQPLPGGALARPFVTSHETLGIDLYLRIAPELYLKRLVIGGLERVYEINRNFRNEGVSVKYNPEFTMLEAYQVLVDYRDMADLLEELVRRVALAVRGSLRLPYGELEIDLERPFRRVRMVELIAEAGADPEADLVAECERLGIPHDPRWPWGKLLLEIYEKKVEPGLFQPTFVMDFPVEVS